MSVGTDDTVCTMQTEYVHVVLDTNQIGSTAAHHRHDLFVRLPSGSNDSFGEVA